MIGESKSAESKSAEIYNITLPVLVEILPGEIFLVQYTILTFLLWTLVGHLDFVYPIELEMINQRRTQIIQKYLKVKCIRTSQKAPSVKQEIGDSV